MDIHIEIEFFKPEYLNKIKDKDEIALLLKIEKEKQQEKHNIMQQLQNDLKPLKQQLNKTELLNNE
jgi:hypothetical protein